MSDVGQISDLTKLMVGLIGSLGSLLIGLIIKILWDTKAEIVKLRETFTNMIDSFAPRKETEERIHGLESCSFYHDARIKIIEDWKNRIDRKCE